MKTQTLRRNEIGSIMLEVVAVLALMGVMGAMLFRQIYQRNQELHNIQMASEIRTVKEAFSAYIQANRAAVNGICESCSGCAADLSAGKIVSCGQTSSQIASKICEYLPDGWFGEDLDACSDSTSGLPNSYEFQTFAYKDANDRTTVYGIVAPTENTLPTTGWNFKRAARVALLVGADGGAYSKQITGDYVNGSLGSWELPVSDISIVKTSGCAVSDCPTYVANTGIDIFAPEYEAPEGKVRIPEPWSLKLNDLHAYNYFSVGNSGTGNCYSAIKHNTYSGTPETLGSDEITKSLSDGCQPLFWVGSDNGANGTSGNVYVQNDLNIGADMTGAGNHALTLTKEGVIKQRDGLIIDKYGRIFSRDLVYDDIGDLKQGEHFVLDLARTSTMKDIRLASRGGVRLSDILPNYILKETYQAYCNLKNNGHPVISSVTKNKDNSSNTDGQTWCDIAHTVDPITGETKGNNNATINFPYPNCPTGYKAAAAVFPTQFGQKSFMLTKSHHTHSIDDGTTGNAKVSGTETAFVSDVVGCGFFAYVNHIANSDRGNVRQLSQASKTFTVTLGYRLKDQGNDNPTPCPVSTDKPETMHAIVQTYCVWYPGLLNHTQCKAAGYEWDDTATPKCTGKPYAEYNMGDQSDALEIDESLCTCLGFDWDSTQVRCRYKFIKPSLVEGLEGNTCAFEERHKKGTHQITETEVITICKMLGYDWDDSATPHKCKCPGDQTWNDKYGCQNPDP